MVPTILYFASQIESCDFDQFMGKPTKAQCLDLIVRWFYHTNHHIEYIGAKLVDLTGLIQNDILHILSIGFMYRGTRRSCIFTR